MKYYIPESRVAHLETRLNTIKKKCEKYGLEFKYEILGDKYVTIEKDHDEFTYKCKIIDVEGQVVAESGYEFVATIDHTRERNIIRQYRTDLEIPQRYYTAASVCEHCNTNRSRSATFLLYNEATDTWKQVGRSCMQEFVGDVSAERIAGLLDVHRILDEYQNSDSAFIYSHESKYVDVNKFLAVAVECVKKFGYQAARHERPTGTRAYQYYKYFQDVDAANVDHDIVAEVEEFKVNPYTEDNQQRVQDIVNWISSCDTAYDSYLDGLQIIIKSKYAKVTELVYVSSIVVAYNNELARREREVAKQQQRALDEQSAPVGSIGDKVEINTNDFTLVTYFDNMYGTTWLYKFHDDKHNVFVWYSSKCIDDPEKVISVSGKVKDHSEYDGIMQTVLTRCKVTYSPVSVEDHPEGTFDDTVLDLLYAE